MKTSGSYSISMIYDGVDGDTGANGKDYNHYKGSWYIGSDGVGYDFEFPPVPLGMDLFEVKINQNDLEGNVRILCNNNIIANAINGENAITEWKSFTISSSFINFDSNNIFRIEHISGGVADWGSIYDVVFIYSKKGAQGIDGDLGVSTLSFTGTTISLQGNGQTTGYIIYNNQKFYINESYICTVGGDGIIIADISQSPVVVTFKKITVANEILSFVDFNTGTDSPITKAEVDSNWQYLLIGEFSCLNNGTVINASLKPVISAKTFLSNEFTSILRKAAFGQYDIEAWSKAMGCDKYYNTLAVSKLFAGEMFANEIILTKNGVIRSDIFDALRGFYLDADGNFITRSATITGNTVISGNATIDLSDSEESLLKTQYGSVGEGSITVENKTRWNSHTLYEFLDIGETGACSFNDGSTIYAKYIKSKTTDLSSCLNVGYTAAYTVTITAPVSMTKNFIIQKTGLYHFDLYKGGLYAANQLSINGIEVFNENTTTQKIITLTKGDNVSINSSAQAVNIPNPVTGEPNIVGGSATLTMYLYEDGLYLYNGDVNTITAINKIIDNAFYLNRINIIDKWDSDNYITLAPINGWYNGLVDNSIRPCKSTSAITIDGEPFIAKYVVRENNQFKVFTTSGTPKTFNAPSTTTDPSEIGWYNITGTIYFAGETRGLLTGALIPIGTNKDIGDALNRYDNIFSNLLNSTHIVAENISAENIGGMLGQGQSWQDMTSYRARNVIRTNDTDRPIVVSITTATNDSTYTLTIDGVIASKCVIKGDYDRHNIQAIVPVGSTYIFSSSWDFDLWSELTTTPPVV
jgi:hypothetical protein